MSEVAENIGTQVEDWSVIPLGELADFEMGQAPPGKDCNKEGKGTLFVKAGEFGELYPVQKEWTTKPLKYGKEGDVFICVVGATAGKLNLGIDCAIGRSVAAIRPKEGFDTKFIYYQLQPWILKLRASSTGSAQGVISKAQLNAVSFRIVTLEQQKRIVAKIEELFSHIDAGIEALKKAKQLLKQYRQSVLKAAVTGELTKEWREANKNKLEPASQLLERILEERRQKWEEQQLEQFKAKGKMPKDDKWKDKYKEPELSAESNNTIDGWLTCRLDVIVDAVGGYAFKSKEFTETGHQIVKMANIKMDVLDLDNRPSFIDNVPEDIVEKYRIVNGDILVTLTGTRKKRDYGYVVRIENNYKSLLLNQRIARLRPYLGEFSRYISLFLQSDDFRNKFFSYETGNVGQGNVGMRAVTEVLINIPSTEEQAEIIRKHDNMLDAMLRLEKDIGSQLAKAEKNKQSILVTAFSGNLLVIHSENVHEIYDEAIGV